MMTDLPYTDHFAWSDHSSQATMRWNSVAVPAAVPLPPIRTNTSTTWCSETSAADLHETPVREIVVFLRSRATAALEHNPYLQESFELALEAGGLAEPILRGVYAQIPGMFDASTLTE